MKKTTGVDLLGAALLLILGLSAAVASAGSRAMASAGFDEDGTRDLVGQTAAAERPVPKTRSLSFQLPSARPLAADYIGPDSARQQLDDGLAQPTALATDDFDEDGVPDLVSGYTGANGGLLTLHLGNVDAIYSHSPGARLRKAEGTFTDAPFLTQARIFETPAAPDFLGAGDFDNDGNRDVVAAARGGSNLYLFPGDGEGGLGAARSVALGGQVTAMIAGEIDRKDNLADVVVGIDSEHGPAVLVFEGPEGALDTIPEVIALPAAPTSLALGRLDDDVFFDLAVAAGQELMILRGRNSKLARRDSSRSGVGAAVLEGIVEIDSPIASIAVGRYVWDARDRRQLALLSADGTLHLLARGASPEDSEAQSWQKIDERHLLAEPAGGQLLVTARVSGLPLDELVVLDRGASRLLVTLGEVRVDPLAAPLSGALDGAPVAALPMRLNRDALSDLVLLQEGMPTPTVAASETNAVITVDDPTEGPALGDGHCQLSEAIANANANSDTSGGDCTAGGGADTIEFAVTSVDVFSGLPAMTDPGDTIDGTTACGTPPCVELRGNNTPGSGLTIAASDVMVRGLVVTDFDAGTQDEGGIFMTGGGNSIVEGNTIKNQGGGNGMAIFDSASNTIGGTTLEAQNLIIQNFVGILIVAESPGLGSENKVLGNYIGTDGTDPLPNDDYGINLANAAAQEFGGPADPAGSPPGNVISSNRVGLLIHAYSGGFSADGCIVQGNLIGLDAGGTVAMSSENGIYIWNVADTLVGGSEAGARNVISGNAILGLVVRPYSPGAPPTTRNVVQGNYIGTDASGTRRLGNGVGIELSGDDNLVGGTASGEGNVISGNDEEGVVLLSRPLRPSSGNQVLGNFIGLDVTGTLDLGNTLAGVRVHSGSNHTIGGMTAGERNIISGNDAEGVVMTGTGADPASDNRVLGNFIGTDVSGTAELGNTLSGIELVSAADNTVGGTADGAKNIIAYNGEEGIVVTGDSARNSLQRNSIYSNGLLGIDLGSSDGVTLNDAGDPDTGPNLLQNFPMLTQADATPTADVTIEGSLNSMSDRDYRIEFFANEICDPSDCGEGERFLGFTTAHTSGSGDVSFTVTLPASVSDGESIAATATDPDGNTSEFSDCSTASCSSLADFGEMMLAQSKDALGWATARDVRFCKGDLASVSGYAPTHDGWLLGETALDISADNPAAGSGLYYLVKPLGCGSWQTALGSEPGRDGSLP